MSWEYLPYTVCYEIFCYLDYKDLIVASAMCSYWFMVSRDDRLWKNIFYKRYNIDKSINNRGLSWYEEFKRLQYNIPIVQTQVLHHHFDQVLHVTFSHNGEYFVTCSRDCLVMIWHSAHPAKLKESLNMTVFNWRCAHYSEFNESDSLLLVSGIIVGPETSTCGEIVVFYVEDFLESGGVLKMKCRIDNTPYSLFGTWYNDSLLFSGNRFWLGGFVTAALIYMNRASQETTSEHIPITHGLFKFYNTNRSSITSLLVANCYRNPELDLPDTEHKESHFDKFSFKMRDLSEPWIIYNDRYREYEDNVMFSNDSCSVSDTSSCSENVETQDKYLIFVTGNNTFIPHEIGIKRIRSYKFPEKIDPGPSLKERKMLLNERKKLMESGVENLYWDDSDTLAEKFDNPDYLIDLHAHILGMRLSPDHRFLYVTIRRWPEWETYNFNDVIDPIPKVQNNISLNVIDLVTLEIVGITSHTSRETYNNDADYYFVYMDVNNDLVVSTGDGATLQMWDRHYGFPIATLNHNDIINAAIFNPKDPEMLVSVSDDSIIKIWRSRSKLKNLKIDIDEDSSDESWIEMSD